MKDKRYRSIIKAVSWRVTGTIDTFVISYFVTGKFKFAISISIFEVFTKIIWYYLHERMWNKIELGKSKGPEYEI